MKLTLLGSTTSPFVRKARLFLAEKKLEYTFQVCSAWDEDTPVESLNPLIQVPVLVVDGLSKPLFDSGVILDFLEHHQPVPSLIPNGSNIEKRALALRFDAMCDGLATAAIALFLEGKKPTSQQSEKHTHRQLRKIQLTLSEIESDLIPEDEYCFDQCFSIADASLGSALSFLSLRLPEIKWQESHPRLWAFSEKLLQRASFEATQPET